MQGGLAEVDFFWDAGDLGGPDKGLGLPIALGYAVLHGKDKFAYAAKRGSLLNLKGLDAMGLEAMDAPNTSHGGGADADLGGSGFPTAAPACNIGPNRRSPCPPLPTAVRS